MNRERFYGDVLVFINDARFDLVHVHFVTGAVAVLEAVGSNRDIFAVGGEQMIRHCFESSRTVGLDGIFSTKDPRTEDQVGITEGVIGMEMGDEKRFQFLNRETSNALSKSG